MRVILLAENVLRQLEARCDLVYKELHDFSLVLKERVLADSCLENVLRDLASQTRRYDHQKLIQLLLVIQIALCPRHEITYLLLDALLQQHVPHGRVGEIELLLETLTLPIKLLHHHGQVTKHVGLHQGAHEQIQRADNVLQGHLQGVDVVSIQCQYRSIKTHGKPIRKVVVIEKVWLVWLHWLPGYPLLFCNLLAETVPDAC